MTLTGLRAGLHAEWGKTWSVWVPGLSLAAAVLIALVTASSLAFDLLHATAEGELPAGVRLPVVDVVGPALGFAQVAVAVFGLYLVTPEYAHGSLVPTFVAEPRRWPTVLAKCGVAVGVGAVVGAATGLGTALLVGVLLGSTGLPVPLWSMVSGAAVVFAVAAVLGVALGFVTRSGVGALVLAVLLLVVSLAAPAVVAAWLPGPAGAELVEGLARGDRPVVPAVVLVCWAAGGAACAIRLVQRRDV